MNKLKCASFFAGVGGIDKGFEKTGRFETVYANEFDRYPCETFDLNFDVKCDCRDIRDVKPEELPDFDVIMGGFPCQAFSIAGYRKGFDDEKGRGTLFFEMARIIEDKQPSIVFLENVKNLVSHDNGNTFRVILDKLEELGYHVKYQVLNAMEYGNTPQNRERIYIVGFKDFDVYRNFDFPHPVELTAKLDDIIDFDSKLDDKYYYTKEPLSDDNGSFLYVLLIQITIPPFTPRICPVIYPAPSPAKNDTAAAISSALPRRIRGISSHNASISS